MSSFFRFTIQCRGSVPPCGSEAVILTLNETGTPRGVLRGAAAPGDALAGMLQPEHREEAWEPESGLQALRDPGGGRSGRAEILRRGWASEPLSSPDKPRTFKIRTSLAPRAMPKSHRIGFSVCLPTDPSPVPFSQHKLSYVCVARVGSGFLWNGSP